MRTSIPFFLDHLLDFAYLCAIAPVAEELVFQAHVQTRLQRLGILPAMFFTTCLFVVVHFGALKYDVSFGTIERLFAMLFLPLFALAVVRQFTGSLLAAIAVHALNNVVVFFTSST